MAVLLLTESERDCVCLADIARESGCPLHVAGTLNEARPALRDPALEAVICDRDLPGLDWKQILVETSALLIVISRLADERLWAEVLNLGGYDVLHKPLDPQETRRVLFLARQQWANRKPTARKAAA